VTGESEPLSPPVRRKISPLAWLLHNGCPWAESWFPLQSSFVPLFLVRKHATHTHFHVTIRTCHKEPRQQSFIQQLLDLIDQAAHATAIDDWLLKMGITRSHAIIFSARVELHY